MAAAKKNSMSKDFVERAIAKGQGVSLSGAPLESVTLEAILPPSISAIIECQTDNKLRTLGDMRFLIKELGGTISSTTHMFERRGRILLQSVDKINEENMMEEVLEAGALDMEIHDGKQEAYVYTDPSQTAAIAQGLSGKLGMEIKTYGIIWIPKPELSVELGNETTSQPPLDEIIGMPSTPLANILKSDSVRRSN